MASDPGTRASDADRDRIVAALRDHMIAGRLTPAEFDERLDRAYAAKTVGELDDLMADLPGTDLSQLPDAPPDRPGGAPMSGCHGDSAVAARPARLSPAWRAAWGSWLSISLLLIAIWLLSGASGGLWFLWVVVPVGALMLGRWLMGAPARGERRAGR
jgi:Domain of unknown function (DUF1707)